MPVRSRVATIAMLAWLGAAVVAAPATGQGSPYLPLDDPRMPLLEHLIARGEVEDPTPQVRPLLLSHVLAALRAALGDSSGPSAPIIAELLHAWELPTGEAWWRVAPRLGAQLYSQGRRDFLHPGGRGAVRPYVDLFLTMAMGPVTIAARPAAENRLRDDPEYRPHGPDNPPRQRYRFIEAYGTAQWRWVGLHFGQVDRNWGPAGIAGIPIGNYAYPRTDFGFRLGNRTVRFEAIRAPLQNGVGDSGEVVTRWFAAHRLNVRVTRRLNLAIWETGVAQWTGGAMDPAILNPFLLMTFGRQLGLGSRRNSIIGGDLTWRASRGLVLQAQGAIDDWAVSSGNPYPNRFAMAILATGALNRSLSWRASYDMNSSLVFRTADPNENLTDAGVGIGRHFTDNDHLSVALSIPVRAHWLVSPQLDLLRQGEGRIDQPWPDPPTAATLPVLFIGTRRDTWQVSLGVSGQHGKLGLAALGGLRHVRNAGHTRGVTETCLVGRIQATVEFRVGGVLPD